MYEFFAGLYCPPVPFAKRSHMKTITMRWNSSANQRETNIFDVADFEPTETARCVQHPVFMPTRTFYGIATCALTADETSATLDYGAYPEANRDPEMLLGATKISFVREDGALRITSVNWREPGSPAFVPAEFEILPPKRNVLSWSEVERAQRNAVKDAMKLTMEELAERLPAAGAPAKRVQVTTTAFARSPIVVAATLKRADGFCEKCGDAAPFASRATGEPYLEVHHIKRLADSGDDHPSNAIALCPNCHRELHHA
jgi:hypothetical protein